MKKARLIRHGACLLALLFLMTLIPLPAMAADDSALAVEASIQTPEAPAVSPEAAPAVSGEPAPVPTPEPAPSESPAPSDPAQGEENPQDKDQTEIEDEEKEEKEEEEEEEEEEQGHRYPEELETTPLSGAEAMVELAEREFAAYGWTAAGARYWKGNELRSWDTDFVEWCARELGYLGKEAPFGEATHKPYDLIQNLLKNGATAYYPGDGTKPEAGDIVVWWCGGRPGTKDDAAYWAMHTGIVTDGTVDQVTVIEGNVFSWAPTKSVLAKNTYPTQSALCGNIHILMFLRPDYPVYGGKVNPEKIRQALIALLYGGAQGMVSCDFDDYYTTEGRHEGIDFCCAEGAKLYAVTSGEIIQITEGDGKSLSTICVYDEKYNKTVVYLHTNPAAYLTVGQQLRYGDYIGTEDSLGATAAHTHIEVVEGYSLAANISVNDDVLDNENPYYYWALRLSTIAAPEIIRILHE